MADCFIYRLPAFSFPIVLLLIVICVPTDAIAARVLGPNVKVREGNIIISTGVQLDKKYVEEIQKGVPKEINFYIGLFRVWDNWPDEFVIGSTVTRTLRCDPVKNEFIAMTLSHTKHEERRFKSCDKMISWALTVPEAWLTNINELPQGEYFVRVNVESRLRRLPPFINLMFFFVREVEFSIEEDSPYFPLNFEE